MKRSRPTKLQTYMAMAEVVAQRSHDAETQVGSILVKADSGAVIASGCNGFARGAPDSILPNTRPDKYKYILHSEENLILNCARHGIAMEQAFVVCTMSPCVFCMRRLWNAGVTEVYCKEKYRDFDEILKMLDLTVKESITPEGFIRLTYEAHNDPSSPVRRIQPKRKKPRLLRDAPDDKV